METRNVFVVVRVILLIVNSLPIVNSHPALYIDDSRATHILLSLSPLSFLLYSSSEFENRLWALLSESRYRLASKDLSLLFECFLCFIIHFLDNLRLFFTFVSLSFFFSLCLSVCLSVSHQQVRRCLTNSFVDALYISNLKQYAHALIYLCCALHGERAMLVRIMRVLIAKIRSKDRDREGAYGIIGALEDLCNFRLEKSIYPLIKRFPIV